MKSLVQFIVSVAIIGGLFMGAVYTLFPAPCATPLKYSIGRVDPQFKLSRDAFTRDVQQAEGVWEKQVRRQLFEYDPNASFTVNLIYDDRQAITDQAKTLTGSLSKTASQAEVTKQQYDSVYASYKTAQQTYEQDQAAYESAVQSFNALVQKYNSSGGAGSQYAALQNQQTQVKKQRDALEQERLALNELAQQVNSLAHKNSQIVQLYNEAAQQFNQQFAGTREFDQGEYVGNAINIYEYAQYDDLQLVLEHELGHALGMGHVENPSSIMYYQVNEKNVESNTLSQQDKGELASTCSKNSWLIFYERLQNAAHFYLNRFGIS